MDLLWAMGTSNSWSDWMTEAPDQSYVGGLQFWQYALCSGTIDGAIRMWDRKSCFGIDLRLLTLFFLSTHGPRTNALSILFRFSVRSGQSHRTLAGHTGPVTTLQFDDYHVVSGSVDRSVRVRTCGYCFPVLWLRPFEN